MWKLGVILTLLFCTTSVLAEKIGSVETAFHLAGRDATIDVNAFDDPGVTGVSCYLSSAQAGGIAASFGLATQTSEAAVTCQKTGPISFHPGLKSGEDVFTESRSLLLKKLHVVRFVDAKRKMLIYLTYTDKLVDGSPKNSISAVYFGN